jgi:hypothetical protein
MAIALRALAILSSPRVADLTTSVPAGSTPLAELLQS